MKKRLLSLFLALCLLAALLPAAVLAEDTVIDLDKENIKRGYSETGYKYTFPTGRYRLAEDIQLGHPDYGGGLVILEFEGDVTFDLNGHILRATEDDLFLIDVGEGVTKTHLTLIDSRPEAKHEKPIEVDGQEIDGGMIYGLQGKNSGNNYCFAVNSNATFTMQGGSIVSGECLNTQGNGADDYSPGGVFVLGTFNMTGGRIIGCSTEVGCGGVAVGSGGEFNMSGGSIENCRAAYDGGGVYVDAGRVDPSGRFDDSPDGTFNMTGGTIKNCTAGGNGGGVYVRGTFNMTGGTIENCTADGYGSGVYIRKTETDKWDNLYPSGTFDMTGGTITGNVFVDGDGKATLLPGNIQGEITGKYEEHELPADPDYPLPSILPAITKGMDFADVSASDWFYDDVKYVWEKNLMTGTAANTFSPDAPVTRGMVLTILARQDGIKTERYEPWYAAGCEWAVLHGISDGTNPEAAITREQLAAMLYRFAKLKGYDVSAGENTNILSYADAFEISDYAFDAMQWACGAGILTGANGSLDPQGAATRAQLAAILHRFLAE